MITPLDAVFRISLSPIITVLTVSESIYGLLGFAADDFLSGKITLQSRIHVDDQDIADELFSPEIYEVTNIHSIHFNFRLRHADGRIRCIKGFYSKVSEGAIVMLELLLQDAKSLWHPSNDQVNELSTASNFKAMMEHTDDYIYFKDRNHVFNSASQALVKITESVQHVSEFFGKTDYDVFSEQCADVYYSLEKQVFSGIPVAHAIQETQLQDGSKGWINNRKFPINNSHGEIVGLFGMARDITESKLIEDELRNSKTYLQSLLQSLPDLVWMKGLDGVYQACNSRFEEFIGMKGSQLIGKTDYDFVSQDRADELRRNDVLTLSIDGVNVNEELVTFACDGHQEILETTKVRMLDDKGNMVGVLGIGHNITERKQAEQALRESEFRWKFAIEGAGDGVWDWNIQTDAAIYSRRWKEMLGYYEDDILPTNDEWVTRIHPEDRVYVAETMQAYLASQIENYVVRYRLKCKDESYKWILGRGMVVSRSEDGRPLRMIGTHTDITEYKNLEEELHKRDSYQRALLDNFPFAVWLKDSDSRYLSVNKGFVELFGFDQVDELLGKNDFDVTDHDLAEAYVADDREVMNSSLPKNVEEIILTEGKRKWFETYKAPLIDKNGQTLGTVGFARDITKRKQAELDLMVAATAFESQEGMIVTDANQVILRVNKAFTRITGYSAEEIIGQSPKILSSGRHDASFYANMWHSLNSTGSCGGEIWNKRKNGEIYPQQYTITAVKNREEVVTHYVSTLVDITDAKQQESVRIAREAELRDSLVREVHHRIKNNLQGVAGMLRKFATLQPALNEPLTSAISQVHSIALIHGLQGCNAKSSILLAELVDEIASNQRTLWHVRIEVSLPNDMHLYRIVETETVPLALVFNELIANAIKHGCKETSIKIGVSVQPNHIELSIINMGNLSSIDHEKYVPKAGTGLKLVQSLLPRKGTQLSWQQHGAYVITKLEIAAPVITLTQ